jgi:hypothetical protein
MLQSTTIHPTINSTISISKDISFFSDDNDEILTPTSPDYTPINEQTISSLQVDSITPMEIETSDKPTKYMSFLSEDDNENNKLVPSVLTQEYISPLQFNEPLHNDNNYISQSSDKSSSLLSTEELSSNKQIETISENIQDSLLNKKDQSSIPVNILDSNRIQIVLRLLNILTQVPEYLKPLRLVRRRIQKKKLPEEQVTVSIEKTDTTANDISKSQLSLRMEEQPMDTTSNDTLETQVSLQREEQPKSIEETHEIISSELHEETQTSGEENRFNGKLAHYESFKNKFLFYFLEQLTIIDESSTRLKSQESMVILFYLNNVFISSYFFL